MEDAEYERSNNNVGGFIAPIIGLVLAIVVGLWFYNTYIKADWIAMYEVPSTNAIQSRSFDSKDSCLAWIHSFNKPSDGYNFECGKNCEPPTTEMGLFKCSESLD